MKSEMQRASRRPSARCSSAGYTLMEMLVVLTLIILAVSVVIPATARAFANFEMRVAARSLAVLLEEARSHALFEGRSVLVIFPSSDQPGRTVSVRREDGRAIDQYVLPHGMTFTGREEDGTWSDELNPLWFFPDGSCEALRLDLRDTRGSHIQLELLPLTGKARIAQIYEEN